MRKTLSFAAAAMAASLLSSPAYAEGVAGTWNLVATTPMGEMKATLIVSEADGAYAVEMEDQAPAGGGPEMSFDSSVSDVAVDGSKLTFKRALSNPQFTINLSYDLTVDGDSLSGKAGSDFGDTAIVGTRAE